MVHLTIIIRHGPNVSSMILIYFMITRKSSSKPHILFPPKLTLEIRSKSPQTRHRSISQKHKIRKMPPPLTPKFAKIENAFESLELSDFLLNSHNGRESWNVLINPKSNQVSSYLAYKHQQNVLKANHSNKMNLIKNKFLVCRKSPEARFRQAASIQISKTHENIRTRRKMSFITLNGFASEQESKNIHHERRSQIYMKTAQGKRQKIDAQTYFSRIEKRHLQQHSALSIQTTLFSQGFEQKNIFIPQRSSRKFQMEKLSLLRHIRTRNLRKEKKETKLNDFRPWSSSKSELLQE